MWPRHADRKRLAATFDAAAALYQRARPEYPRAIYDRLLELTALSPPAPLVEVGCATGEATLHLAQGGFRIVALEPGAALAAAARANLAAYDVEVIEAPFEDWDPSGAMFDLVFAGAAWHWVNLIVRFPQAAAGLRPGGHLAIWGAGHVIPYDATRSSRSSKRSTTRLAKGPRPMPSLPGQANCPTTATRSRARAGSR